MMNHWKRILAAAGTAALLVSNLGSVSQAVFAIENYTEGVSEPTEGGDTSTGDSGNESANDSVNSNGDAAGTANEVGGESDDAADLRVEAEDSTAMLIPEAVEVSEGDADSADRNANEIDGTHVAAGADGSTDANGNGSVNDNKASGDHTNASKTDSGNGSVDTDDTATDRAQSSDSGNASGEENGSNSTSGSDEGNASDNANGSANDASNGSKSAEETVDSETAGNDESTDEELTDSDSDTATDPAEEIVNEDTAADKEAEAEEDEDDKVVYDLSDSLEISLKTKESGKHDPAIDEDGVYLYNLGETASTTLTIRNPEEYSLEEGDDAVVRLYMRFTDTVNEDAEGTDDANSDPDTSSHGKTRQPGTYTVTAEDGGDYTYTVSAVDDGLYCYEFERPIDSDGYSVELTSVYKDDTNGGENQIWVVALTEKDAAELDGVELVEDKESSDEEGSEEKDSDREENDEEDTDSDENEKSADDADTSEEKDNKESGDVTDQEESDAQSSDEKESADRSDEKNSNKEETHEKDADDKRTKRDKIGVADVPSDDDYKTTIRWGAQETAEPEDEIRVQTTTTDSYVVSVAYSPEAEIPEDAELRVTEYDDTTEEFRNACDETDATYAWVLDVSFYVGDEEYEPKDAVSISVAPIEAVEDSDAEAPVTEDKAREQIRATLAEDADAQDDAEGKEDDDAGVNEREEITLVHFADSGIENVTVEGADDETVTFSLDSLSIVARQYKVTVDTTALSDTPVNVVSDTANDTPVTYADSAAPSGTISVSNENLEDSTGKEYNNLTADAVSDPGTSNIEDSFGGSDKDGKIRTDKSVTYGTDDYNSGLTYEDGEFGVTLSALAQEYSVIASESYTIPMDVVFVLDVSGSMKDYVTDPETRISTRKRVAMVDAVNSAMTSIMAANADNRAGVVLFSSGGWNLLDMDHYTAGSTKTVNGKQIGQFLSVGTGENDEVYTAWGLKNSDGRTINQNKGGSTQNLGTYTQYGIALGYENINQVQNTSYSVTVGGETISGQRQPIIILVSDGMPTHLNDDWDNVSATVKTNTSGNGSEGENKAIGGYYTVLSANYYKSLVTSKYNKTAKFYTIGEGVRSLSDSNLSDKDYYTNAVLNPSKSTMDTLNNQNGTYVTRFKGLLANQDSVDGYVDVNDSVTVGSLSSRNYSVVEEIGSRRNGSQYYTTLSDAYYYHHDLTDYAYADGAWFGEMGADDLATIFATIIEENLKPTKYSFALDGENPTITITDSIGTDMEMKGDPVLVFGGTTYALTKGDTTLGLDGSKVTTYTRTQSPTQISYATAYPNNATAASDRTKVTFDLSQLTVTVTTDASGNQTVEMDIPASLLPVFYPNSTNTAYYHEDPIRLVYKVGLTDKALSEFDASSDTQKNYYTNSAASAGFVPATNNEYRFDDDGDVAKAENATSTNKNSFSSSRSGSTVTQSLGNNGMLTLKKKPKDLIVEKVWQDSDGDQITGEDLTRQPVITAELFQKDSWTDSTSTYNGVTLTIQARYRTSSGNSESNYTTETIGTAEVKSGTSYSAQIYAYRSNDVRPISSVTVDGSATATTSNTNWLTVSDITSDTTVLVRFDNRVSGRGIPSVRYATYTEAGYDSSETPHSTTTSKGTFKLSSDNDWQKYWSSSELGEQSGHTYQYYVKELTVDGKTVEGDATNGYTVEGYTISISNTENNPLTATESNKTITITNKKNPSYELPSTGGWGTLPFEVGGSAAILSTMFVGYSRRRRHRKEGE